MHSLIWAHPPWPRYGVAGPEIRRECHPVGRRVQLDVHQQHFRVRRPARAWGGAAALRVGVWGVVPSPPPVVGQPARPCPFSRAPSLRQGVIMVQLSFAGPDCCYLPAYRFPSVACRSLCESRQGRARTAPQASPSSATVWSAPACMWVGRGLVELQQSPDMESHSTGTATVCQPSVTAEDSGCVPE